MKHTKFAHGIYYFGEALRVEVSVFEAGLTLVASIAHRGGTVELLRQTHPWDVAESVQALVTAVALDSSSMLVKAHEDLLLHYAKPQAPLGGLVPKADPQPAPAPAPAPAWRVS